MKKHVVALFLISIMTVSTLTAVGVTTASGATATPNYSSDLNNRFLESGYKVSTPFKKTTVYGRDAYVGAISKGGTIFKVTIFPMDSYASATDFRDHLITTLKGRNYWTIPSSDKTDKDSWFGVQGNNYAVVTAINDGTVGGYAVMLTTN